MPACHAGDRRFESGRVRHLPLFLRPVRPPGRGVLLPAARGEAGPSAGRRSRRCYDSRTMKRLPLLVVLALLALAIALPMSGGMLGFGGASPGPTGIAARPTSSAGAVGNPPPASTETPPQPSEPAATPDPTPVPETPTPLADVAVVPVTHFRAVITKTDRAEVAKVLAGTSNRYEAVVLVDAEADAILTSLGAAHPADASRLVLVRNAAALTKDLAKHGKRLAFLRADAVTLGVRALAWGDRSLFGVDRVTDAADWRLHAQLPGAAAGAAFDPAATWTMFAGGDILLDRGVYQTIRVKG